jgi:pimeloyl-ACP methyl ester carboxylesterase
MTAAAVADQVLRLGDGRALGFKVYGDPTGAPLLFLHGTPGSRLKFAIGHGAGMELGLAIVAPDRWGYGLSDAPDAPSLPAFAADMAALMDHLGHAHFAVGGISGGGPYAASVAAHLASRATALALVSPMGPVTDPACRRSLSHFHRFCFGALPRSPLAIATVFALFRASLDRSPRLAAHLATLRAGPRDKALLAQPEIARWLLGCFREGLSRGLAGPVLDLQLFSREWGIDLDAVRAPARLWIGTADTAVPLSAARLLARSIGACDVTELPAQGHFWVAANYGEVLEWVAAMVRARAETRCSLQSAMHTPKAPSLR